MNRDRDLLQIMEEVEKLKHYDVPDEHTIHQKMGYSYTEDFTQKIEKYDKKYIYVHRRGFSKTAILIAAIIALLAGSITAYAVYTLFRLEHNEKNTDLSSILKPSVHTVIEDIYIPRVLPEGYVLSSTTINDDLILTEFYHESRNTYLFMRQMLYSSFTSFDNEDTEQIPLEVNGMEAIYTVKHGESTLFSYFQGYLVIIDTTDTDASLQDLIDIAESLTLEGENE